MNKRTREAAESGGAALDACWNRIGVRGDHSCPELQVHIHCRNCPVYSTAARALLDAPLPADALGLSTRHFAQASQETEQDAGFAEFQSIIVFRLRAEWFALPTALCLEVADLRPIHSLPHRRNGYVLGVANVRGGLLICLSLAEILGLGAQTETQKSRRSAVAPRLLVTQRETGAVVFPVDEIDSVQRVRPQDLKETPATVARARSKYTKALLSLDRKIVGLLDEQLLFYTVERSLA